VGGQNYGLLHGGNGQGLVYQQDNVSEKCQIMSLNKNHEHTAKYDFKIQCGPIFLLQHIPDMLTVFFKMDEVDDYRLKLLLC